MKGSWLSSAKATPPAAPTSFSNGYPTDGDPLSSEPPTSPGAWWFHMVTQEVLAVIAQGGLTPSATTLTQLRDAILSIAAGSGPVASVFGRTGAVSAQSGDYAVGQVTGAAPLASPALTGTPTINASAALALANFTGANQTLAGSGYQTLPGGLILQWSTVTGTIGGGMSGTFSFPVSFPNNCFGVLTTQYTNGGTAAWVLRSRKISNSQYGLTEDNWNTTGAGATVTATTFALGN